MSRVAIITDTSAGFTPQQAVELGLTIVPIPFIINGEEYIENDYGEYAHWECVDYGRDLAKFLGYAIKEMDDEE